jgi:uncharacterized protein YdaU (DUF1376 family)
MHTYPFHAGDYLKDTVHWSEDEALVQVKAGLLRDLAYRRLLDLYYGEEEPIPAKTRLVAIRIRMLAHEEIVASVLKEKFKMIDGRWHQKRTDAEIAKYQKKAAAARENGKKGGRPTKAEPNENQPGSKQVTTRTRTRTNRNTPLPPEGVVAFGVFWDKYPRKVGKPKALVAYASAVGRGATYEQILAGLALHVLCELWQDLTKVPHPTTWLNRDGWNDQVVASPAAAAGAQGRGWWETRQGIFDKGVELGIPGPVDEHPTTFIRFKASVWVAAGHDGPWWDKTDTAYDYAVKLRDGGTPWPRK